MGRIRKYAGRVNIIKRIKVGDHWPFASVVERKGKLVRDHVLVAGRDEHHPEGRYYLEWYESGKRRRQAVSEFERLTEQARRKLLELSAIRAGIIKPESSGAVANGRITVASALEEYLHFVEVRRSLRTFRTYRYTLDTLLRRSYCKTYVDQVEREDVLQFITNCFAGNLDSRTVYDKLVVVLQFFKHYGKTKLIRSSDWPEYVDKIRPIYEPDEIQAMLAVATADEAIFMKFLLGSGFRDREVRFLVWSDIDFRNSLARVTTKPLWRFRPKNWEERVVPLPSALIEQLSSLKERRAALAAQLVFPNSKGRPDSGKVTMVKIVAERAKLNCGQCLTKHGNRCSDGPYCQRFFLHKFRHTFATEHLRHGIDIRTLQGWMGHRDIQSTMVYLKGIQSKDALARINSGALAEYAAFEGTGPSNVV